MLNQCEKKLSFFPSKKSVSLSISSYALNAKLINKLKSTNGTKNLSGDFCRGADCKEASLQKTERHSTLKLKSNESSLKPQINRQTEV
jgi:hypothetical protein